MVNTMQCISIQCNVYNGIQYPHPHPHPSPSHWKRKGKNLDVGDIGTETPLHIMRTLKRKAQVTPTPHRTGFYIIYIYSISHKQTPPKGPLEDKGGTGDFLIGAKMGRPSYKRAYTELIRENYTAYVFETQNHGLDYTKGKLRWKPTVFHKFLTEKVQEFIERDTGHPYDILLISTPPQVGKSVSITETLPSWYLGRNPEKRVIEISYNADFAKRFGRRNRDKINEFGYIFGISLSSETKSMELFELSNKRGSMLSAGAIGGVTGNACDLMIIDDPIKNREEADSETVRRKLYDEWINSYKTRLSAGAKVIVIQTRWHEDDLFGQLMRDPYATVMNFPMEAEEDDILGRKVGEPLVPEIGKNKGWLKAFKKAMEQGDIESEGESGIRAWNALYQGRPTALEGNLLQRDWWQYYEYEDTMEFEHLVLSVDAAFKDNDSSDFVAMEVWGKRGPNCYLVDITRKHLNFQATMDRIMQYKALYPLQEILVEDKANGTAIIQVLRRKIEGIIAIEPRGSKESRVNAVSFAIESGNVYLPKGKKFVKEFVEECSQFPNGKHDDMVDSMSMALARLIWRQSKRKYKRRERAWWEKPERSLGMTKGKKIHVI